MESSHLLDKTVICLCFNPIRDSLFILSVENEKIDLTEEDLSKNIILRRFKLLKENECNIVNTNFRKLPKDTFEGYGLYFWELVRKIIVVYPNGYLLIYDYQTSQLNYHFQCQGKKAYVIRNVIGSPIQQSLFLSAEGMRNVYHINYENLKNGISYQKLVIPVNEAVYDLTCHPNEKFIFVACSDSIIRIFDYSNLNQIREIKNGLVDIPLTGDGRPPKNQSELIKKSNILGVIAMDINLSGTLLISGNENGYIYLWDAYLGMKNKRQLLTKERFSASGVLSLRFIKTKQFGNLDRFICLTKEGKFYIFSIIAKDENSLNNAKSYVFQKLYENSSYNPIIYPLTRYNLVPTTFINISYFANLICLIWPCLKLEKMRINDRTENYLLFTSFNAKFFYLYDNDFPKINFPLASRMKFRRYEDYIPVSNKNNLIFERRIFMVDNFFIYCYDIMTGTMKKVLNYTREFNLKAVYPLKFEVKELENPDLGSGDVNNPMSISSNGDVFFLILIENENSKKVVLMIYYDLIANVVKLAQKFEDVIDFTILGGNDGIIDDGKLSNTPFEHLYLIHKDRQHGQVYYLADGTKESKNIEATVNRVYHTPFSNGYSVLYRNILNELKFSSNLRSGDIFDFKCTNDNCYRLDYSEREIDVLWNKLDDRYFCSISMVEKIIITDESMKILFSFKTSLIENPNIISSMFWIGKTLFYSKGSSISYFYGEDSIHQKIFTSDQPSTLISGVLSDRYLLVSKIPGTKDINNVIVTTPVLNPLEPILIGYLDSSNIDYNLVKEMVTNMHTNHISQNLIDKLIKKDLKEVAWLFLSDTKSSFQNIDKKVLILNDLLKFDCVLENIITNKDLTNEMHLDELMWKFQYDQSVEYIKNILIGEFNILLSYGQFDTAMKILELLGDYPKAINLLLLSASKEEYEKLRVLFQAKGCLSFTDNLLINSVFFMKSKQRISDDYSNIMKHYTKVFDNYKYEPFIFGANQDKFTVMTVKDTMDKINKKNSYIANISKKILSYGETPFSMFTNVYNHETCKYEPSVICSLLLQKIDHYYGYHNTILENEGSPGKQNKRANFQDFSVPLIGLGGGMISDSQAIPGSSANDNNNLEDDRSLDPNAEELSESLYLTAYYHCDKGSGNVIEDITENNNEATLIIKELDTSSSTGASVMMVNAEENKPEDNLWSSPLEEFEPLEYEDKWGRKSPGAHAIKFSKKLGTYMKIRHNSSFSHFNKKFTVELWMKIFNVNVTIFSKESLLVDIQNGNFQVTHMNKVLPCTKVIVDYTIPLDKFIHLAISYKKKNAKMKVQINCEEICNFALPSLGEEIGIRGDIIFGNGNMEGELTEIKIWNQEMPIKFLKDNYKTPLPILAENKRKLRMKINKQEGDAGKKKYEFGKTIGGVNKFTFSQKSTAIPVAITTTKPQEDTNSKGLYEFNPITTNVNEIASEMNYPTLSVINEEKSMASPRGTMKVDPNENTNLQFGFKFEEINNQNFEMGGVGMNEMMNNGENNFNFQINDFNFEQ